MYKPLVTIAIPTYNRANKYLRQTLECALQQTYENIEILVSDNCSTDNTSEVVGSFTDSRLKYFRQKENLGAFGNWNFLLENARGDYFHMYHDDDQIDPDFVETCMIAAKFRADNSLIVAGSRVIDKDGVVLREKENRAEGLSTADFILYWYQKKLHLFLCSSLFGVSALRSTGGFETKYQSYIDVAAQFNCAAHGNRVDVREVKAGFREHPGSNTSSLKLVDWCEDSLTLLDLACTLAPSKYKELRKIGLRTSADRVYRYASESESKLEQLKGYWTVLKHFKFKQFPSRRHLSKLFHF